jgi:hypothetical protein
VLERKLDERTTFLRWKGTIEGHRLESLELLVDGPDGLLVERTIAYRPFPHEIKSFLSVNEPKQERFTMQEKI